MFVLLRNVDILLPAIVGGMDTIAGSVVVSFVVIIPRNWSRFSFGQIPGLQLTIYGLFLVCIVLYSPRGVPTGQNSVANTSPADRGHDREVNAINSI